MIPMPLKYAMGAGIGLFITLIAFRNAHIIRDHAENLMTLQDFSGAAFHTKGISAILALAGLLFSVFLMHRKIMGSLLYGILATWALGISCQLTGIYHVSAETGFYSLIPQCDLYAFTGPFHSFCNLFGSAFDVSQWSCRSGSSGWSLLLSFNFIIICLSFLFSDFFDTIGTINGTFVGTTLMDKEGKIPRLKRLLIADSAATFFGGIFGTSTTTTFAESAVGVNAGARTGLAAMTAGILFLISLICAPLFLAIPGFATAPALIIVGFLMMRSVVNIDWNNLPETIPAYLLIIGIVFTCDISDGLGLGIISYTILNCRSKGKVHPVLWGISVLFIAKYIFL